MHGFPFDLTSVLLLNLNAARQLYFCNKLQFKLGQLSSYIHHSTFICSRHHGQGENVCVSIPVSGSENCPKNCPKKVGFQRT